MKVLKVISLLLVFMLFGCGKKNYITCTINVNNDIENYKNIGTYKIYYNNSFVTKIEKEENYISDETFIIDYFAESKELEYYDLNDRYGGLLYNINKLEKKVSIKSTLNFKEFDLKSMVKDGKIDRDYVINGRLTTIGIKRIYESRGAICNG